MSLGYYSGSSRKLIRVGGNKPTVNHKLSQGTIAPSAPPSVSGGVLTSDATYYYRTFTASDTLTVTNGSVSMEAIVIGGGGNGGGYFGGGGGAGGLLENFNMVLTPNNYVVTVGAAGRNNTTFNGMTAFGGGNGYGQAGGSGGGTYGNSYSYAVGGASTQTSNGGGTGYGSPGEDYTGYGAYPYFAGSGGGGAGGGRDGRYYPAWAAATGTGDNNGYAGGGAGNYYYSPFGGNGPGVGIPNTGSANASGIVIVRYLKSEVN
jgi:hypothetical protein